MAEEKAAKNGSDDKRSITVRVSPEIHAEIEKQAVDDERTVSQFVERHLRRHFTPKPQMQENVNIPGTKVTA